MMGSVLKEEEGLGKVTPKGIVPVSCAVQNKKTLGKGSM